MSVPAAKARSPAPRMIMTFSEPSSGTVSQISRSRSYMAKVKALRAAGRLKVTVPIPSSTVRISSSSPGPLAGSPVMGATYYYL
jgi:hypothetical protein